MSGGEISLAAVFSLTTVNHERGMEFRLKAECVAYAIFRLKTELQTITCLSRLNDSPSLFSCKLVFAAHSLIRREILEPTSNSGV